MHFSVSSCLKPTAFPWNLWLIVSGSPVGIIHLVRTQKSIEKVYRKIVYRKSQKSKVYSQKSIEK